MRTSDARSYSLGALLTKKRCCSFRSELGIALIDDHIQNGVAHALIGDLAHFFPAPVTFEVAEIDFGRRQLAIFGFERIPRHEALDQLAVKPDVVLPFFEEVDPVVERCDASGHAEITRALV
jgi:hypothetical protein